MMDASRHFSPVGHVVPACVSESMSETLRNTENSFLRCIEVADGFVHSEWIVTERGPHLIEFAVRFPGGGLSRLIEYVYGINLAEAWVRLLAGREIPSHKPPGAVTAVLYFSGREGRLISVDGFDFLKSSDWVIDHRLLTPTGSRISDIRNSLDRVGYVMIKGNTYGELEARLRVIRDAVTVQVEL
jgi:biotin carboxylase